MSAVLFTLPSAAGQAVHELHDWMPCLKAALNAVQVCGEATYVDDMKMHGMLHAALVVSSRPHAKILSVDATAATRVTVPCNNAVHCAA